MDERCVVRLRGLPWSATDSDIVEFLGVSVVEGENGIKRTFTKEGRPSGEAYVEVLSNQDMSIALKKDHANMGKRYIEVFRSSVKEMDYVLTRSGEDQPPRRRSDAVVRLRGLPYQCTKDDISNFFSGLEIVPNGITLPMDSQGRSSGEAYVEFGSQECIDGALAKHKDKIGHRYIEIFKSTRRELQDALYEAGGGYGRGGRRPGPYDRPVRGQRSARGGGGGRYAGRMGRSYEYDEGGYADDYYEDDYEEDYGWEENSGYQGRYGRGRGMRSHGRGRSAGAYGGGGGGYGRHYDDYEEDYYEDDNSMGSDYVVHMRGLPFKASDNDISDFFSPIVPVRVHREYGRDGRVSGEADVEFASYQDAQAAMQKNNESMQHRYIELFYRGGQGSNGSSGGGFGRSGGRGGGGGGGYGRQPRRGGGGGGYRF